MRRWLPHLKAGFSRRPWLLLADPRLAGMFLLEIEDQFCTLFEPDSSLDELRTALRSLADGRVPRPAATLVSLFSQGAPALSGRGNIPSLTPREVSIGCGLSLGLTDVQIAEALGLSDATVADDVYDLRRKLRLSDRKALAELFTGALAR